jgi:hypothetical protein
MNSGFDSRLWIFLMFFSVLILLFGTAYHFLTKKRTGYLTINYWRLVPRRPFSQIYYYPYFSPRTLFFLLQIYLIHNCHNFTILFLSQENDTNNLKFNRELNKMRLYIVLIIKNLTHFIGKFLIYYWWVFFPLKI